jgi:hypothetical protein
MSVNYAEHAIWTQLNAIIAIFYVKVNFEICIADLKLKLVPVQGQRFFCSAVLTPQHCHWYAATQFAFHGG